MILDEMFNRRFSKSPPRFAQQISWTGVTNRLRARQMVRKDLPNL